MIKKVFSICDEKAHAWLQPFFFETTGLAIRAITDCVNDPNHSFNRHAADYTLFQIAQFDDHTAEFEEVKICLGNLVEFKNKENES